MINLGKGPCLRCGYVNDDVLLTGETRPAHDGGTLWYVADGEVCGVCGIPLTLFLTPPIVLELPARVRMVEHGQP